MRCSGKSCVGERLAEGLGLPFFDSDLELARRFGAGATAGELLASLGEPSFRQLEWRTLAGLLETDRPAVIATGGGAATNPLSRELLRRRTSGIYLRADPGLLAERAERDSVLRPALLANGEVLDLKRQWVLREPLYFELSMLVIEVGDRSPEVLAKEIETELRSRLLL